MTLAIIIVTAAALVRFARWIEAANARSIDREIRTIIKDTNQ